MESSDISEDEVRKILLLSHLDPNEESIPQLTNELNSILRYVRKLFSVDVSGIEPMTHVSAANWSNSSNVEDPTSTIVCREDIATRSLTAQDAIRNAPDSSGNFFRVPLVIGEQQS